MARHRASSRPLVGRESQLEMIASLLDELHRSRGAMLLLSGEPGIGKTRLAEEIVARTDLGDRSRVAWATAWHGAGAPPLWPWVQILRQLGDAEHTLAEFLTDVPAASEAARFAQFEAVCDVVREATAAAPLVIVLDDLQWVDAASIRLLVHVASTLRTVPCLFVAAYRPDELAREYIADLTRVGVSVHVPRLPDAAAVELLDAAAGVDVPATAAAAVVARSGGNPLFVWEFGQLMAQSGRVDVAPSAIPDAVTAVIERRLARLPEDVLATLRAGAVMGRSFSIEDLAQIAGADSDPSTGDLAAVGLQAAAAAGLLVHAELPGEYRFAHDLVRDVVAAGTDPARRAVLHLRSSEVFAARVERDPSFHAVIADHLEQAGAGHVAAAATHWEAAAGRARSVLAYHEAATCYARAARLQPDRRRRAELVLEEGDALLLGGDLERARSSYFECATLARQCDAAELFARAALGTGTGPVAWEVPIGSRDQVALVTDALGCLPEDAFAMRARLLARLSIAAATPDAMDVARQRAEQALALADEVGDPALIAQALAAVNDALAGPAHAMTRRDNADTIVELAVVAGDRMLELLGYRFRIVADLELGDLAAVDRSIAAFTSLAELLHQPLVSWYVPLFRGMRALLGGDLDAADRCQREVAAAAASTASHNAEMLAETLLLGIDVARGRAHDPDAMDGLFDRQPADWASYAAGLAMLKWRGGQPDRARQLLMLHAGNGFARLGEDGEHLTTLFLFGRVAVGLGELDAARAIYDLLAPHSGLWAVDGIAACCWGPVDLELARLALATGDIAGAREWLAQARDNIGRAHLPLLAADVAELATRCEQPAAAHERGPSAGPRTANLLRREGQFWTLVYRGRAIRVHDAKGLRDLAQLLARPGFEIHVLDLVGPRSEPARAAIAAAGDHGELLDARARAEYRRRLAELEDDLADAERCADLGRAERAAAERDFLAAELAAALGLDGRPRRAGDAAERARKAVTARIRLTIGRIGAEHPELGRHLENSLRTGTFCAYRPEGKVVWSVELADLASRQWI